LDVRISHNSDVLLAWAKAGLQFHVGHVQVQSSLLRFKAGPLLVSCVHHLKDGRAPSSSGKAILAQAALGNCHFPKAYMPPLHSFGYLWATPGDFATHIISWVYLGVFHPTHISLEHLWSSLKNHCNIHLIYHYIM